MDSEQIRDVVEQIAEILVLSDAADLQELAELHTHFQAVAEWAASTTQTEVAQAAQGAAVLIEKVILGEAPDADAAMDVVGRTVKSLQSVIRDGRSVDEAHFPSELQEGEIAGADRASARQAAAEGVVGPRDVNAASGITLSLPAGVDEAIFGDFLARQGGVLDEIEAITLALEKEGEENGLPALRRIVHTLKGESGLLGLADVERLCHAIEDVFNERAPGELVDPLLCAKDWLGRAFDAYAGKGPAPGPVQEVVAQLQGTGQARESRTDPVPPVAAPVETGPVAEARPLEGDTGLMGDFVAEANEHLDAADVHLLTLETDPLNEEALNAVFRAFHTIKGVAGFLNLDEILSLAHEAENLLDRARKGDLELSGPAIDVTFDAVDALKQLVANLSEALVSGGLFESVPSLTELIGRIKNTASGRVPLPREIAQPAPSREPLGQILIKSGAATSEAVAEALAKQSAPPAPKKIGDVMVESAMTSRKTVEHALDIQAYEPSRGETGEILVEMGAVSEDDVAEALEQQERPPARPRLGELLVTAGQAAAKDVAHALRSQGVAPSTDIKGVPRKAVQVREAVKVDAIRLDRLVDTIGELVIAESMVRGICLALLADAADVRADAKDAAARTQLSRHLGQLDKITRELQEMGTSLRMVPVRATFQKMARLVRDLAKKSGKEVEFVTTGEDTELDKTVVDKIGDPLVHMVRNAVDHGIEATPEERRNAGKPPTARVELHAFHKGGSIYIQIEDDGRGLDRDAILAKALERGIVTQADNLSDRETWNLIFEPGFSTAKKVTDVSGRGVGMDVVRRNIESLRGHVEIASQRGKGSTFTMQLPLTLAIIDGMVVRVGTERYIIPTLSIIMSIRPEAKDLTTVVGRGEMLSLQGRLLPLFRLARLFGISEAVTEVTEAIVVVVESDGCRTGLLIDEILGQQQIVIKSLGESIQGAPGIAGGAIMPDGQVGLILDVGGIVKLANET